MEVSSVAHHNRSLLQLTLSSVSTYKGVSSAQQFGSRKLDQSQILEKVLHIKQCANKLLHLNLVYRVQ